MSEEVKGIVLHGGHGTRLRPLTHTRPKQLLPVANKPISQYSLEGLVRAGIKEIAIVLGDVHPDKVRAYYGRGSEYGAEISYVYQGEPRGIAHAIGLCEGFVGDSPFVACLGDNLLRDDLGPYVQGFIGSEQAAMLLLSEVRDGRRYGMAEISDDKVRRIVEKPETPPSRHAVTGHYFLRGNIFEMIERVQPSWTGELEMTSALQLLVEKDYHVGWRKVTGWWIDVATPRDLLVANRLVLNELETSRGERDQGKDRGVVESSGVDAALRRPVSLGRSVSLGDDVKVGPYASLAEGVNVSSGEVRNSVILSDSTIEVGGRVSDSVIGSDCRIRSRGRGEYHLVVGDDSELEF
ncbi:MAG: glucose-1-phosphate thymidylyltransferase [Thermoplasmata archaeon]